MPFLVLVLLFCSRYVDIVVANAQLPKIFIDVEPIEVIDPLKRGFQIILKDDFVNSYLSPGRLPTIFLSAMPLNPALKSQRLLFYREEERHLKERILQIQGLEKKTWYYVCLEFENVIRPLNKGNTSTKCEMRRTLDDFGMRADSIITDIQVASVKDTSMEFAVSIDCNFPVQLTAYLQHGSCPVQNYILSDPRSLVVEFLSLEPGYNYGRLCFIYEPLMYAYTMLGRTVHMTKSECHFDSFKTKAPFVIVEFSTGDQEQKVPPRPLRIGESVNSAVQVVWVNDLATLICCVLGYLVAF